MRTSPFRQVRTLWPPFLPSCLRIPAGTYTASPSREGSRWTWTDCKTRCPALFPPAAQGPDGPSPGPVGGAGEDSLEGRYFQILQQAAQKRHRAGGRGPVPGGSHQPPDSGGAGGDAAMRICSMTATFGKLEWGETLEFTPGLNLISAPNEWGKAPGAPFSWPCSMASTPASGQSRASFRTRERFKPWSGKPMSRVHGNSVAGPPDHH